MRANPTPMRFIDPLDYEDARQALKASAERIRAAEDELAHQIDKAAKAEAEYRRQLAREVLTLRTGKPPKEDRRGDRASLHKIVDWSMKVAPTPEGGGETFGRRVTA